MTTRTIHSQTAGRGAPVTDFSSVFFLGKWPLIDVAASAPTSPAPIRKNRPDRMMRVVHLKRFGRSQLAPGTRTAALVAVANSRRDLKY